MVALIDGGGAAGPFDQYPVTTEAVRSAGDRLSSYAGNVEMVRSDVAGVHQRAQEGVAGLLAAPMVAAEQPVRRKAQQWLRSSIFAGGAVRLFADAVAEYNRRVHDLNRRYWEAKQNNFGLSPQTLPAEATHAQRTAADDAFHTEVAHADRELLAQLRKELHQVVEPALDDEADHVASLLDKGPDDEGAVVELYAAGTLPMTAPLLFQQHDFSGVPLTDLPDGGQLAERMQQAMDGDLSPDEFAEMMAWLEMIAGRVEHVNGTDGAHLSADEVAFLHEFYNGMGDRLWDLPGYIRADQHRWDEPGINPFGWFGDEADGFDATTQDDMLGWLGTGMLALSNNQLWPPSLREHDPMDPDAGYHLPETVIDLVSQTALDRDQMIRYPQMGVMVERWDDFAALAHLLEHTPADLEAGTTFSEQTTTRVAELAAAAQLYHDSDTPGLMTATPLFFSEPVSTVLEPLLEVSTRNHEANHNLLTGDAAGPFTRVNLHADLDDRQLLLAGVYGFEWSDDGAAAAGLTDWISERADTAAADGRYDPMATEAAAALVDLVTTTERGEGHDGATDDYRVDMYDRLMETFGERNPEIARSFSRVASSYLDDFSEPSGPETLVESDGSLSLSDHDKIRFLDLIATDDQAINGLSFASGEYQQRLLTAGLDGETSMIEVGQRSSRLDGLLAAARVNADVVGGSQRYDSELAAYEEHMRYAGYGKTAGTTLVGLGVDASPLKPASPFINAGLGHLTDEIINGAIPAPERDPGFNPGDILDLGRDDTYAAHEYLNAMIANDQVPEGVEVPDELFQQAPPYPGAPFETTVYENGKPVLKPVNELDGGVRQELFNLVGDEDNGIGGDGFAHYRNDYEASNDYQRAVARDAEAHRQGLR